MGHQELIEALRREAEQAAEEIRRECRAEAGRIREDAAARIAELRGEYAGRRASLCSAAGRGILAEADLRGRLARLTAENALADRLYEIARRSLHLLRGDEDDRLFAALAGELPRAEWESVTVNPADGERAARHFPAARIVTDGAVSGGMEAVAAGGRLRVINTLEKRLERAWPELLPLLASDLLRGQ